MKTAAEYVAKAGEAQEEYRQALAKCRAALERGDVHSANEWIEVAKDWGTLADEWLVLSRGHIGDDSEQVTP